jgi:hypothetical protein
MTRVELVRLVGDVLRQLDLKKDRSADLSRVVPTEVRNALAKQQLKIAITELDESTPTFFNASEEILAIDARLRGTAESADDCVALVDSLRSLVKTLDGLVTSGN